MKYKAGKTAGTRRVAAVMLLLVVCLSSFVHASAQTTVKVGVMLPLHDDDGDGRRMIEYYRGILMACEQLRGEGISTDIRAWNVAIGDDIRMTLLEKGAPDRDIIFGPLYTRQVQALGEFAKAYNIKVVIPFSINGNDVDTNPQIFQVYRSTEDFNNESIERFLSMFGKYHPVFIDCNDRESGKGIFTFGLRRRLEALGIDYGITNVNTDDKVFACSFSTDKPNIVILNTARSPELTAVIRKLDALKASAGDISLSMYGYTEWLMYENADREKFFEYDTYIPSYFYYNPSSAAVQDIEKRYRANFSTGMINALPRFAITGYDHAMFFIRGMARQGDDFIGGATDRKTLQSGLKFVRAAAGGGMKNAAFMLVHYNRDKSISTITF